MNRARLLPIACLAAGAFAATSSWLWFKLEEERLRNAELEARLSRPAPAAPPEESHPSTPPAAVPVTNLPIEPPASVGPVAKANRETQVVDAPESSWQARQRLLLQDPRYVEEVKRQQRMMQAHHRQHATGAIGLSDAQFDAAVDLWAEREIAMQMARTGAEGGEARAAQEAADRTYEESLENLLDEPLASRWKHYRDSLPTRMRVTQLRSQLTGADTLRDDQFEPLIEAMEVEQSQLRNELRRRRAEIESGAQWAQSWRDYQEREIELFTETRKRVLIAASPILSSSQLEQLAAMYEREIEGRRSSLRMNQLQQKIIPPGQPSGMN
jgi:hypothetical protein